LAFGVTRLPASTEHRPELGEQRPLASVPVIDIIDCVLSETEAEVDAKLKIELA
jgi:hypothetical protein